MAMLNEIWRGDSGSNHLNLDDPDDAENRIKVYIDEENQQEREVCLDNCSFAKILCRNDQYFCVFADGTLRSEMVPDADNPNDIHRRIIELGPLLAAFVQGDTRPSHIPQELWTEWVESLQPIP